MSELNNAMFLDKVLDMILTDAELNNPRVDGKSPAIPFIIDDPGAGKTESLLCLTKEKGWGSLTTHLSTQTIEELTGLPDFVDVTLQDGSTVKGTRWSFPDVISQLHELSLKHKGVIWFMDDFHLASQENQKFCFQLFTDYALKGYAVPDNVHIVLAGNPTAKAGAKNMLSAISNRVAFYFTKPNFKAWEVWAEKNGVHSVIRSFLKHSANTSYFHQKESTKAWASPRSWTKFSRAFVNDEKTLGSSLRYDRILYRGEAHIGNEAAHKFGQFWKLYSNVDVAEVFEHETINIPSRGSQDIYVYVIAMVYEYINRYIKSYDQRDNKEMNRLSTLAGKLIEKLTGVQKEMGFIFLKEVSLTPKKLDDYWEMLIEPQNILEKLDPKQYEFIMKLTVEMSKKTDI